MRGCGIIVAAGAAILAAGCQVSPVRDAPPPAAPPPQAATCNASDASWAVGQHATERVAESARISASARTVRIMRPGEAHTMEYSPERLNLETEANNIVRELRCG